MEESKSKVASVPTSLEKKEKKRSDQDYETVKRLCY